MKMERYIYILQMYGKLFGIAPWQERPRLISKVPFSIISNICSNIRRKGPKKRAPEEARWQLFGRTLTYADWFIRAGIHRQIFHR
jgi:hypothetical protein